MTRNPSSSQGLHREIRELRARLEEAEHTLHAIRCGEVDALIVSGPGGQRVFTLQHAERTYRLLVENMSEGAAILTRDGGTMYCNRSLAALLRKPMEQIIGNSFLPLISLPDRPAFDRLIREDLATGKALELNLAVDPEGTVPVLLSAISLEMEDKITAVCLILTDMSAAKRQEEELRRAQAGLEVRVRERTADLVKTKEDLEAELTARRHAERSLRESEANLREAQRIAKMSMWSLDRKDNRMQWPPEIFELFEIDPKRFEATYEAFLESIHPEDRDMVHRAYTLSVSQYRPLEIEYRLRMKDGRIKWVKAIGRNEFDTQGEPVRSVGIVQDITERKQREEEQKTLEEQLRQSQKMEAVGHLAGGVAHDFNNLLQVILMNADSLQSELMPGTLAWSECEEISSAGRRAADLTRQLLAFSRRQVIHPVYLDLNDLVQGVLKMLRRLIEENIQLCVVSGHKTGNVFADKGQMEQVLLNLCINARDAMPKGGRITIEIRPEILDRSFCSLNAWAKEGAYALLSVADTGAGMDASTLAQVFEPFFTTKGLGKGTGLGLSSVYGIVKQHHGLIHASSKPGEGSVFQVYLPIVEVANEKSPNPSQPALTGGKETILISEDDTALLHIQAAFLRKAGYTVLTAADGLEALQIYERNRNRIDLVVLDVMMPNLGGKEVMDQIRATGSEVPILFTSGYSQSGIHTDFVIHEQLHLIQKPYEREVLLQKIRQLLDRRTVQKNQP